VLLPFTALRVDLAYCQKDKILVVREEPLHPYKCVLTDTQVPPDQNDRSGLLRVKELWPLRWNPDLLRTLRPPRPDASVYRHNALFLRRHTPITALVTTTVSQPPAINFSRAIVELRGAQDPEAPTLLKPGSLSLATGTPPYAIVVVIGCLVLGLFPRLPRSQVTARHRLSGQRRLSSRAVRDGQPTLAQAFSVDQEFSRWKIGLRSHFN
jgi:hypothetical protein